MSPGSVADPLNSSSPSLITFDERGLVVAVAQDRLTGQVRMVAWMDRQALEVTLQTGKATFYSRSRSRLWTKGETSGNWLYVTRVLLDCDGDTLMLETESAGPSCHTGRPTCFFRSLDSVGQAIEASCEPGGFLERLEQTLLARQQSTSDKSYTKSLFEAGAAKISAKLHEEVAELSAAIDHETAERVTSEAADVIYHLMVALRFRNVDLRAVLLELDRRSQLSGHEEKARRPDSSAP